MALKALTVSFQEPALLARLNAENRGGDRDLYRGGPLNPQALNRYSYVLNNPVNATDPTGHYLECQRVTLSGWSYETVTATPGTSFLDGQGGTVYADEDNGVLYRVNTNGQRERLYKVTMPARPGCGRGRVPCIKYVYEYDTGFQDFKRRADAAMSNWNAIPGDTLIGAGSGCLAGGVAGGGAFSLPGCAGGAVLGGAGAAIGTAAYAAYREWREYKAALPVFDYLRDRGKPGIGVGPPKPRS